VSGYFVINVNENEIRKTKKLISFKTINSKLSFRNVLRLTVPNTVIISYRIRDINNAFFKRPSAPFTVRNKSYEIARILNNTRSCNDDA
jgi:hypothetical protein